MQTWISKLINLEPKKFILLLSLLFGILIFSNKYKSTKYGDFGIMQIQLQEMIATNFQDFSIQYQGKDIDPNFDFYPFEKPFVGKVSEKFFIVFPIFFPILNSLLFKLFSYNGLYIINYLALVINLFLINELFIIFNLTKPYRLLGIFLYSFCGTIVCYNFIFHEYPLAILTITVAIFFALKYHQTKHFPSLFLFGLFSGLSLFFRLDFLFTIIIIGLFTIFFNESSFLKIIYYSFLGIIVPVLILFYSNYTIHGHPLGLRYVLNLEESNISLYERSMIIFEMLLSPSRGLLIQSSFVLAIPIGFFFFRKHLKEYSILLLIASISTLFILLSSPNDGGHKAPRYLFSIYPFYILICCIFLFQIRNSNVSILKKNIYTYTFLFFCIISFLQTIDNLKLLQKLAKNVIQFNNSILKESEDRIIIFRDRIQSLNSQEIYLTKTLFTVINDSTLKEFLMKPKFFNQKIIIVHSNYIPLDSKSKSFIESRYERILKESNHSFHLEWKQLHSHLELLLVRLDPKPIP
ncbi:MAG: hypothetical protein SFU98_21300 [Leptospiraceae bacterium]|nr:hypothetical protein [Leptospiraceae bacterium]